MNWIDIACIVFACVTANHLGLVRAIEEIIDRDLPVFNCVKCLAFWSVLTYSLFVTHNVVTALAVSFLAGYMAIWLELLEGYIDKLYMWLYDKIYTAADTADD